MSPLESKTGRKTARRSRGNATSWPSLGVFFLLLFCFVIMSEKLPLGEVAVVGAVLAMVKDALTPRVPGHFRWYLLYVLAGSVGFVVSSYAFKDVAVLLEVYKVTLIGVACSSLLNRPEQVRAFAIGYLALFALFPVRGVFYNFIAGIGDFGRFSWNFFFSNPNDLAMSCLLPIGLCGYLVSTAKGWVRLSAALGIPVLMLVVLLTQSRGAMLGVACGVLYLLAVTRERWRVLLLTGVVIAAIASVAPGGAWDRLAGLSKVSVQDMSMVDPEGSAESRWTIMGIGVDIATDHPLAGVGIGNYPYYHALRTAYDESVFVGARGARDTHSMYIRAAAEAGLPGAVGVIGFVLGAILTFRRLRQRIESTPDGMRYRWALLPLEMSMVVYAVAGIFASLERATFTILQFVVPWAVATVLLASLGATAPVFRGRPNRGPTASSKT